MNIEIGDLKPDDIEIEEWKPELPISNPLNEKASGSVIQNNVFGHLSDDKNNIEIEELMPELPILNSFSGHEILTEQAGCVIQKIDFENQALTKQKCHICDKVFDNLDLHFLMVHSQNCMTEVFKNYLDKKHGAKYKKRKPQFIKF